jgi:ribosomal protein L29
LKTQRLKEDQALELKQLLEESKKTLAENRQKSASGQQKHRLKQRLPVLLPN